MANTSITTTYVGQLATPFVAPAILSADSIANGYISTLENVRHQAVLKKFSGGAIADRTCTWNSDTQGSMALSDVVLTTQQLQVNEQICNKDLAQDWAAAQMRGADAGAPNAYAQFISNYVQRIVAKDVENNLWQGDYSFDGATAAPHTSFQGIMSLYAAVASPTHETETAGAWTGDDTALTGIMLHLAGLVADAPADIAGDPDAVIIMSRSAAQLYYQGLAAQYQLPFLNDGLVARYAGYKIVTPAGMSPEVAILTKPDNIYFGTNVLTDMIEARILDLTNVTGDAVTRVAMNFDAGCQIVDEASMAVVRRTS